jgi:hypothetical protein
VSALRNPNPAVKFVRYVTSLESRRQVCVRKLIPASAVCVLVLTAGFLCPRASAQIDSWMADRELAADLNKNGVSVETDRATVWFESGVLDTDAMNAFAGLVNRGILDIEAYLGVSLPGSRKIRFFVSSKIDISHSNWRSIYLPMSKVQHQTAPYLHETTHVVAPCDDCPMWFGEGLASFVQSYVSEHTGGYDGGIFTRRGNRGIDQDARRWLVSPRGQAVVPFIGVHGEPPEINYDRSNVAAPFYVMAQSFVKYLAEHATMAKLRAVFNSKDFDTDLQTSTGKSAVEWKQQWLAELGR